MPRRVLSLPRTLLVPSFPANLAPTGGAEPPGIASSFDWDLCQVLAKWMTWKEVTVMNLYLTTRLQEPPAGETLLTRGAERPRTCLTLRPASPPLHQCPVSRARLCHDGGLSGSVSSSRAWASRAGTPWGPETAGHPEVLWE